jgi:predicted ribosomally synthesized peptide with SipW-like signal peptide
MKKILLSVATIGVVGALAAGATMAWFSDTETSTGNTFTAGTLALNGTGIADFNFGTLPPMAPGEITEERVITIKNDGTTDLAWFGDLVIGGGTHLRDALYIDYAKMEFMKTDGTTPWEPVDNFITNGRGSGLYPSWYNTLADNSSFHLNTLSVFDGNNGMGTTPYEFMGALKPGYSYKLTLKFGFAPAAGNEYQGNDSNNVPVTIAFKADAVQINADALNALHPTFSNHLVWLNTQISHQN